MMKKLIQILIVGLLFVSSTGFAVSLHFCGDHLVSVFVNSADEPCCGEDSQCCHNETDYLQMETDGLFTAPVDIDSKLTISPFPIAVFSANIDHQHSFQFSHHQQIAFSPPLSSQNSLVALQAFLL